MGLWGIQVTVAVISLAETLLVTYLGYKVKFIALKSGFSFTHSINDVKFKVSVSCNRVALVLFMA